MNIRYQTALLFVKDLKVSREFYTKILNQKIQYDFGEDVVFRGGFAIHDANHFSHLLFQRPNPHINDKLGQENLELYFECDEPDEVIFKLTEYGVKFIHLVQEQPWGQRVCRFYDPDNHIIEIGEPMTAVIKRYLKAGLPAAEIAEKTTMPLMEVKRIQGEI